MTAPSSVPARDVSSAATAPTGVHPGIRIVVMLIVAVVAAGLSSAVIGEVGEVFGLTGEYATMVGGNLTGAQYEGYMAARLEVAQRNAAVWLAVAAAILGTLLAITIGLLRRAGAGILIGAVAGLLLSSAVGAVAGFSVITLHNSLSASVGGNPLSENQIMIMHGVAWAIVGLGVGLACGLARRPQKISALLTSVLLATVLGGVGGVAFPIVVGVVAPLVNSALPIPEAAGRLVWIGLPAAILGLGLGRQG